MQPFKTFKTRLSFVSSGVDFNRLIKIMVSFYSIGKV